MFADARPNDRVRAYVRARLQHDWTVAEDPSTEDALALFQRAARPGDDEARLTLEDELVRAQARVALWKGGKI